MEVIVVCTGRRTHKRQVFNAFTLTDDGELSMKPYRVGNEPTWRDVQDDDGATLVHTPILPPSYDPRTSKGGWRWQCQLCSARRRFSTAELAAWLAGKRVADISDVPT